MRRTIRYCLLFIIFPCRNTPPFCFKKKKLIIIIIIMIVCLFVCFYKNMYGNEW